MLIHRLDMSLLAFGGLCSFSQNQLAGILEVTPDNKTSSYTKRSFIT